VFPASSTIKGLVVVVVVEECFAEELRDTFLIKESISTTFFHEIYVERVHSTECT
jgi:hypothetical protein